MKKYLVHITLSENANLIMEKGTFRISRHVIDGKPKRIQWLGDGIYFWSGNCDVSKEKGKSLVRGRSKGEVSLASIELMVDVEPRYYWNLDEQERQMQIKGFLEKMFQADVSPEGKEKAESIFYMFELIREHNQSTDLTNSEIKAQMNTIYGTVGSLINLIMKELEERGEKVKVISYSHCFGTKETYFEGQTKVRLPQYCIRNNEYLPNKNSWTMVALP